MKTALTVLVFTIIVGVGYWLLVGGIPASEAPVVADEPAINTHNIYESPDGSLRFAYPLDDTAQPISSDELPIAGGLATTTISYPAGSIEISGLFVISKIPFSELSSASSSGGVYDYYNCCTGAKYTYDEIRKEWRSDEIYFDPEGSPTTKFRSKSLVENNSCKIKQVYGNNTYYLIPSGDEAIPTSYYYFLVTNQGYAYRFLSKYDLQYDFSAYPEEARPDPLVIQKASELLASVSLGNGVQSIEAACL